MYNEVLADRVRELKETEKGELEMCKELEELYEEGVELGKTEERTNAIKSIVEEFGVSVENAMDVLKIPLDSRAVYMKKLVQ